MRYLIVVVLALLLGVGVWYVRFYHAPHYLPLQTESTTSFQTESNSAKTTVIAENLDTPWALAFLPDGSLLVTERLGRVRLIENGKLAATPVVELSSVREIGEGGLLGIALDPQFITNNFVYLYYTYDGSGTTITNRVVKMTYEDKKLSQEKILLDDIPSSSNHDGGRIKFGSDGYLYVTTGDAESPSTAQDRTTLNGKILRITTEGQAAPGNPYNNLVYSYGHRNPQGLAWDNQGNLWSSEHGRSGATTGLDELNLIRAGLNYGWPIIQGNETRTGMETPVMNSGSTITWAPAGMAYLNNSLFFGGLKGEALYKAVLNGTSIKELKTYLKGEFGRIRDVVVGPDQMLYLTTSNRDGRGTPGNGDDKVIKVNPEKL